MTKQILCENCKNSKEGYIHSCNCTQPPIEGWEERFDKYDITRMGTPGEKWQVINGKQELKNIITQELQAKDDYYKGVLVEIVNSLPGIIAMKHAIKAGSDAGAGHTIGHNSAIKEIKQTIQKILYKHNIKL